MFSRVSKFQQLYAPQESRVYNLMKNISHLGTILMNSIHSNNVNPEPYGKRIFC